MPKSPLPSLNPEEWLAKRFVRVAEFNPRFESSWYGLHIALLSHYFPYQQRFLIKPQPRVREAYEEEPSFSSTKADTSMSFNFGDDFAGDISITSTGVLALSGATFHVPDFTITKATEFATHDKLLVLVEVKPLEPKDESGWCALEGQMDRYMDATANHLERDAGLVGLLICGTAAQVFRLASPAAQLTTEGRYDVNSPTIRRLFHGIAKENWEQQC